jgi:trans-2,3-dihydro-3-hydroxyanthranilate isomerase
VCRSRARDGITARHEPIRASVGLPFVIAEVTADALSRARPNVAAFTDAAARFPTRPAPSRCTFYARPPRAPGEPDLRARMFSPLGGTFEDPATGSANGALGGLLATLAPDADTVLALKILQGAEMGRPSMLTVTADKQGGSITRIRVGGRCVPAMEGSLMP